ncbi:alpha/beta fold hydrolase [Clostridium arbusti]|uniref:alpha/beta fold hydrolase n=1 Tax=Clostridium arbusti TaxID=1137848 RepID=UPI0002893CE6|nr:alpha/beta hydrolase [Clostridium arbusti]
MKIIDNIADNYALRNFHKKYSKTDQFNYDEEEVNELNSNFSKFYKKPKLPKIHYEKDTIENNYEIGKIKFLSEVENGESNKEALFHYRKCLGTDNNINVILIHGWQSETLNRLDKIFLDSFIERRYNIYSYVQPFHMERTPNASYSGEYYISADVNRTLKSVQQSVSDIRALINYIKTASEGKIIIIGLSLGGIVSNLLAETEENIDWLVSLFYGNDLSFTVFESEAGKYIKKDFLKNNFDYRLLKKSWSIINPSLRKPILNLDKILLVSGKHDKVVLNKDISLVWENWQNSEKYIYNCGHSGTVLCKNRLRKNVLKFIDKRV